MKFFLLFLEALIMVEIEIVNVDAIKSFTFSGIFVSAKEINLSSAA